MNSAARAIGRLMGWEQNPASVFYLVIPLAALGFGLMFVVAYMHYKIEHNPVFFYIWLGAWVLLIVALIPGFRTMRMLRQMNKYQ
jgi:hypothetical protein